MKLISGLSAALLGTTLLAGAAMADPPEDNPPPRSHPHFSASGHSQGTYGGHAAPEQSDRSQPRANFGGNANANANITTNTDPGSWAAAHGAHVTISSPGNRSGTWNRNGNSNWNRNNNWSQNSNWSHNTSQNQNNNWNHNGNWNRNGGSWNNSASRGHWNSNNLRDHNVSHFNTQDRAAWQHGRWQHARHHGRDGWWWNSGGSWFFYDQPTYPYPGYVSNYYYSDDLYDDGDDGYAGDEDQGYDNAAPGDGGYYWYYCSNPAGYYPYVKSCRGPWRAVTPTPDASQQGYDQNDSPDANDEDDQGPPPGYDNGPDDEDGPPPPPR